MDNFPYLFAAYTIIWIVLLGYVLVMFNRQARLKRELDSLKEMLKEKEEKQS
jgi:CcmD family protein